MRRVPQAPHRESNNRTVKRSAAWFMHGPPTAVRLSRIPSPYPPQLGGAARDRHG